MSVIRRELDVSDPVVRRRVQAQWVAVFGLRRAVQRDAWDFTRIPGRARSHTKATPTWETWRLVGTLDGHLAAYRHRDLPAAVSTAAQAATEPAGSAILAQPTPMPAPSKPSPGSWWAHTAALAVVFTGLPAGDLVMPVRLPQGARQWAHLSHFLADPAVWHKIDLVRVRDRRAPGGWRLWGKRISVFSPGMLVAALACECQATAGRLDRAGTRTTAMSQHCLCGQRVPKTLAQRTHHCPHCGLHGDRDIASAALAACVELTDPDDPRTARVDYRLAHALRAGLASQQEWEGSVNRHQPPTPEGVGSARTGSHHLVASAEHAALDPPPNRPGPPPGRHGTSRKQPAPKLIGAA